MSLRTVLVEVEPGRKLPLLLRFRELRRLELEHGLAADSLTKEIAKPSSQGKILHAALEGGSGKKWTAAEVDEVLDLLGQLKLRLYLGRTILEAYGKLEPGDEELLPDPKGPATDSPPDGGSAPSPSPSA